MQMTDGEVVMNIMQAKDQRSQITICADLNCCSEEKIKDILKANDIDLRSLKGGKKHIDHGTKHKPRKVPYKKPEIIPAPPANAVKNDENAEKKSANAETDPIVSALATLYARVAELRQKRDEIEAELVAIDVQVNRISDAIAGRGDNESTQT